MIFKFSRTNTRAVVGQFRDKKNKIVARADAITYQYVSNLSVDDYDFNVAKSILLDAVLSLTGAYKTGNPDLYDLSISEFGGRYTADFTVQAHYDHLEREIAYEIDEPEPDDPDEEDPEDLEELFPT